MEHRRNFRSFIKVINDYLREIDLVLFATVVAISLLSIFNMYGIAGQSQFFNKQITFVFIGLAVMVTFSFFNYRYLKNYSLPVLFFYFIAIFLLGLTFYSQSIRGVNSWIVFRGFTVEPSELTKLILIVIMAKYFSQRHIHINEFKHILISGVYFIIPALLIFSQPDLGSAIIVSLIWMGILMIAGINKKHFFILVILGLLISYGSWLFILKPYQKERFLTFLNQAQDPHGAGYNLIQSKIAIGSGHFWGYGWGKGSQVNLHFLPESHNDFVFAAIAEQFGFLGIVVLLSLVFIILSRIIKIGRLAGSNFAKLFSLGLAIFIFSHALIGAAVNIGLLPITGIPFPFVSYGGSNFISLMIGTGILQSIKRYG